MTPQIRRATADDTGTIVRILIASKEASFPDTIDDHDRDVDFWTRRWHGYITRGSQAQKSLGDGWVLRREQPVHALLHEIRGGRDAAQFGVGHLARHRGARGAAAPPIGFPHDRPAKGTIFMARNVVASALTWSRA
ncbi:MAG TPA: hypothetical protein VES67_08285 [Vicinamibacterales bacterium]|nr:hypothetical protein [Vicinamibacterales bacterium]